MRRKNHIDRTRLWTFEKAIVLCVRVEKPPRKAAELHPANNHCCISPARTLRQADFSLLSFKEILIFISEVTVSRQQVSSNQLSEGRVPLLFISASASRFSFSCYCTALCSFHRSVLDFNVRLAQCKDALQIPKSSKVSIHKILIIDCYNIIIGILSGGKSSRYHPEGFCYR